MSFTQKRERARFAGVVSRRCSYHRLHVERVRAGFETRGGVLRSRSHGSTRISLMAIFKKPAIKAEAGKKREIPRGLFQKCPGCSEVLPEIELAQNQRVCPRCDHHFAEPAKERIQNLLDPETFVEMDANLKSVDVLRFQGMATYKDRLKKYQESTGLFDAVTSGKEFFTANRWGSAGWDLGFLAAPLD